MKQLLLLLCLLAGLSGSAQNWLRQYGGVSHEEILNAEVDASGNTILVGYFNTALTIGFDALVSSGSTDILIMKMDASGTPLWAVKAGGAGSDRALGVDTDGADNIYVTGYVTGAADFGPIPVVGDGRDAFVCKLDSDGNFIYAQVCGGSSGDSGNGITVDNSSNVYITGEYKGVGTFGADMLTSMWNPTASDYSYDPFISKLDAAGNFVWTRDGNAKFDDKGLAITCDNLGDVYVVGQFSDTITFDVEHDNVSVNSAFMVKYDAAGNEVWFNKFQAGLTIMYDVKWDDNKVFICGDYQGTLLVTHQGGSGSYPDGASYNSITARFSNGGVLEWLTPEYSESQLSTKQLTVDSNHDIYVTGTFMCTFNSLNDMYGESLYRAVGDRDVFMTKYLNSGTISWARQAGGRDDDYCSAIAAIGVDQPILGGSFQNQINVPAGAGFSSSYYSSGGCSLSNCGDSFYWRMAYVLSSGGRDIFVTRMYDPSRLTYDYFEQTGPCTTDTIPACINNCDDTAHVCEVGFIGITHFEHCEPFRPKYDYLWNTGGTGAAIAVGTSGWYSVTATHVDGCYSFTDSIWVEIHPNPAPPLITDEWGYNFFSPPLTTEIDTCATDTLEIYGSPGDEVPVTLTWDEGEYLNDTSIFVTESGTYTLTATSEYGCTSSNYIEVTMDDFALNDTLDPHIVFSPWSLHWTDSIVYCENGGIWAKIIDSNFVHPDGIFPNKVSKWYIDGGYIDSIHYSPEENWYDSIYISISDTGWHTITVELINKCGDSSIYIVERDIYVQIVDNPYVDIYGPTFTCPGDTVVLYITHFEDTAIWIGSAITENWGDSVQVVIPASAISVYAVVDTMALGITCSATASHTVNTYGAPAIIMTPADGIMCPGDSILMVCEDGVAWQWIDPTGDPLGTDSTQWASSPGFYLVEVVMETGCEMVSNSVEVIEYSSPFILVDDQVLCDGEVATAEIFAPDSAVITWLSPLSGSDPVQVITGAGTYYVETTFCGITNLDSIIIYENDLVPSIYGDSTLCEGDLLLLTTDPVDPGVDIVWTYPDMTVDTSATVTISPSSPSNSGTYSVYLYDDGCTSDTTSIEVIVSTFPTGNFDLPDTLICEGDPWTVDPNVLGDSVVWLPSGTNSSTFEISAPGTYYYIAYNGYCETVADSFTVGFNAVTPTPPPIDSLICTGDSILFDASTYENVSWFDDTLGFITNSLTFNTGPVLVESDYFYFVQDSGICPSEMAPINITLKYFSPPPYSGDFDICKGESVTLMVEDGGNDGAFWLDELGDTISTGTVVYLVPGASGTVFVNLVALYENCPSDTSKIAFTVHPVPDPGFPDDTLMCQWDEWEWDTGYPHNWEWGVDSLTGDTIVIAEYWNEFGCYFQDTVVVHYEDCYFWAPNVFTPNGDGLNDLMEFRVKNGEIKHLQILNRWGNTLYKGAYAPWSGLNTAGLEAPDGVYYYIISWCLINGEEGEQHGAFTLLRN